MAIVDARPLESLSSLPAGALAQSSGSGIFAQMAHLRVTSQDAPSVPTVTLVATSTGNVTAGSHRYRMSFVTANGETQLCEASATVTVNGTHKQVDLTIPVGPSGVIARKIYRTLADSPGGREPFYFLAAVSDNTTTTYRDNIADGSLGAVSFSELSNTTAGRFFIGEVPCAFFGPGNSAAWGYGSLSKITDGGGGNSAFGYNVLHNNVGGIFNTGSGFRCLESNVDGSWNVGSGDCSLVNNVSGYGLTAAGWQSLSSNVSNKFCAAFGYGALNYSTADYLTAMGAKAGYNITTGPYTSLFGYECGYNLTTGLGNSYFGYQAGWTGNGSYNVFLGKTAGYYETGSNKLFIDNDPRASEEDAREKALIYGVFDADPANQVLTVNGKLYTSAAYFGSAAGQRAAMEGHGDPIYGSAFYLTSDCAWAQQGVRLVSTGNLNSNLFGTAQKPNFAIQYSTNTQTYGLDPAALIYATALVLDGNTGNFGIHGVAAPTAQMHFSAGSATAGTAPIKLTSGTLLGTPEPGAIEYDGTHFYGTKASGTRVQLDN